VWHFHGRADSFDYYNPVAGGKGSAMQIATVFIKYPCITGLLQRER